MKYFLLFFVPLFFTQLLPAQKGEDRVCIQFDSSLSFQELSKMPEMAEVKIMVFQPGKAWVRGSNLHQKKWPSGVSIYDYYQDFFSDGLKHLAVPEEYPELCGNTNEEAVQLESHGYRNKGLSDTLKGHTICSIFFVNQTNGSNPWNTLEQSQCMDNAALNLLWWSEQASFYGVDASFELKPFLYTDPVCQINVDPTIAPQSAWATQILAALGYDRGDNLDRQIEYIEDLIAEEKSNWGFIAFIIRGASTYRSNAFIFGPSTTCTVTATRAGFTFAHEVGHIFGLRDEYEERAIFTFGTELNNLANLNADFRNIINAPCIMKISASVGICSYNPVHLHWTDAVDEFEIITDPADARFIIRYINASTNQPMLSRIHQGRTLIPMGLGARFRLEGLEQINLPEGIFEHPSWDNNGQSVVNIQVDSDEPKLAILSYETADSESDYSSIFLEQGVAFAGRRISALDEENGAVLSLSTQGLVWQSQSESIILDVEREIRPGDFLVTFRNAHGLYKKSESEYLVGSQLGFTGPEVVHIAHGKEMKSWTPPQSFREQGAYAAVAETQEGLILAAFEGGGLHVFSPDSSFQLLRQGILSERITALSRDPSGRIIIGYDGGRLGNETKGVYELKTDDWSVDALSDAPVDLLESMVRRIKYNPEKELLTIVSIDRVYTFKNNQWASFQVQDASSIWDADQMSDGRWVVAANNGLYIEEGNAHFNIVNITGVHLQDNFVRAVTCTASGIILAGHNNYGISAIYPLQLPVAVNEPNVKASTLKIYPNPNYPGGSAWIKWEEINSNQQANVQWVDLSGKVIYQQKLEMLRDINEIVVPHNILPGVYLIQVSGSDSLRNGLIQIR